LPPFGPRKRRGPRFIFGKVRRGTACEEKLHHLTAFVRAAQASGVDRYSSSRVDMFRAGVEKNGRALDGAVDFVPSPVIPCLTNKVKRLMLPVHEVRTHAVRQQRAEHVRVCE
jgi:hypothetical protein